MTERFGWSAFDYNVASAPTGTPESTAGDLAFHARGFELSLASANKRPNTIKSYLEAVGQLDAFLAAKGMPRDVENIRREHFESFNVDQLRLRPASAANRYRSLQHFFKWLTEEGWIIVSSMANMKPPAGCRSRAAPLTRAQHRGR